jgi:hypothetical protein
MENLDNLVWLVYFIDVVLQWDMIELDFFLFIFVMSTIVWCMICFIPMHDGTQKYCENRLENFTGFAKNVKKYYIGLFVFCFMGNMFNALMPERDTAYKMLAVYGGIEVLKNPDIQRVGGKGFDILEKVIDEYLGDDLKEVTKEDK